MELLENTEKVIADGHLLRTHMQLVERSKALRAKREVCACWGRRRGWVVFPKPEAKWGE